MDEKEKKESLRKLNEQNAVNACRRRFDHYLSILGSITRDIRQNERDFENFAKQKKWNQAANEFSWARDRIDDLSYNLRSSSSMNAFYNLKALAEDD